MVLTLKHKEGLSVVLNLLLKLILSVILSLKGPCHGQLFFLYVKVLYLLSSGTYFLPKSDLWFSQNKGKSKNPGASEDLKSGYQEQYWDLKTGYPEQ